MNLLLWRHADAEEGFPDVQRKLSAQGEQQARQVAAWVARHAPHDLRLVCSPAQRCQQTAQALSDLLGRPYEIDARLDTRASALQLLAVASEAQAEKLPASSVLLVGHQPTLGQLAAYLLAGEEAEWTVKKGALWWFSCTKLVTNAFFSSAGRVTLQAMIVPELCQSPNVTPTQSKE